MESYVGRARISAGANFLCFFKIGIRYIWIAGAP